MVQQLTSTYPYRFAAITYQVNGDAFSLPWGQNRLDGFYRLHAAVPSFMVDGLINSPAGYYVADVEQRMSQPTDVTLELTGAPVGGSVWDVTSRVCLEGGGSRPVRVYVAPTFNEHPDLPDYATNVLMQEVFETDVTLTGGGCTDVTNRIEFNSLGMANPANIVVVAWVQEPTNNGPASVYQAGVMRWPFPADSRLTTIEVTPSEATLYLDGSVELSATGKDQHGAAYPLTEPVWTFGIGDAAGQLDPTTGTTTTFTPSSAGTRHLICTENGVSGSTVLTILEAPHLDAIEIDPAMATVEVGGQIAFSVTGTDQFGEPFELTNPAWTIAGAGDGAFDPVTGTETTFTASYPGAATVTCTSDGISTTAAIDITGENPALTTITVDPATAQLRVGDDIELSAVGADQYGRPIEIDFPSWYIDGDGDGTFDPVEGSASTFTATGAGSARLICAAGCGVEGAATVEIAAQDLPAPRRPTRRVTPQ